MQCCTTKTTEPPNKEKEPYYQCSFHKQMHRITVENMHLISSLYVPVSYDENCLMTTLYNQHQSCYTCCFYAITVDCNTLLSDISFNPQNVHVFSYLKYRCVFGITQMDNGRVPNSRVFIYNSSMYSED